MPRILIVEDDRTISKLIAASLSISGYESMPCYDGREAVHMVKNNEFDLILLDVMLPGMDGFEVMEAVRGSGVPVIFLTAMGEVSDRVKGLKSGAEDYIVKPFEPLELLARIEIVLRRFHRDRRVLNFRDIVVNLEERSVRRGGELVELTPKEYELLVLFLKHPNVALTRDKILDDVWECPAVIETRTVDNHVQRLRRKLGLEECLKTVFKVGYRLEG
jgi:two-component system alkaline phosphatase synthesis response regulator PhoP